MDTSPGTGHPEAGLRARLRALSEADWFQRTVIVLVVVNAVVLGLETSEQAMQAAGTLLIAIDRVVLALFVVELAIRIAGFGWRFFRDPWSIFDFLVVAVALVPATEKFSVLRALRVLRVLRLISAVPRMRNVVRALLSALPGLGAVSALLGLIFYVAAVMATTLFGEHFPNWFGNLGASLYTLFQVMTLESWSMGIVRPVMEVYPHAWAFFLPFILVATFTMLNLFIAVVVNAMQSGAEERHEQVLASEAAAHREREVLLEEVRGLRREINALRNEHDALSGDGQSRS